MSFHVLVAFALMWFGTAAAPQADPVTALVARLEQAVRAGDAAAIRELGRDPKAVAELVEWFGSSPPARIVLKERDRTDITEGGQRVLIEAFSEQGSEGRLVTFSVDLAKSDDSLKIAAASRVGTVGGLYRLALNAARQYDVKNLTVRAPDLTLHMASGTAFVAETPDGPTAVVLVGRGEMLFSPPDAAERTQVRIFCGNEALKDRFEAAFIRVRPVDYPARFAKDALVQRQQVSPSDLRRASNVFEQYVGRTLQIDLGDLSGDRWSITPQPNDLIAEIRTDDHGSLTYTRSWQDQEDVTVFDRARRKNISVYASSEKLAKRGRFYSEDEATDYDVLAYDVDARLSPDQSLFEGSARLKVRIRAPGVAVVSMRLAETLAVRGVYSPAYGRLLHLRVVGQNSLIVSLPVTVPRGTELWLTVLYRGRLQPQELDREAIQVEQEQPAAIPPEPRYVYSHRSYWYPQATVSDYALARVSISLPSDYDAIATGTLTEPATLVAGVVEAGEKPRHRYVFESERPVRYLALVISRFRPVNSKQMDDVMLTVTANARQAGRARGMSSRAEEIFRFYKSVVGRAPYPTFTLAFTERDTPGGHSPAYFAVVDQVPYAGRITWRNDPVNFESYPAFFVAHEMAHQWWGQAVGWKNYHEQWISEGFAQYFALLYAEKNLADVAPNVIRQMRQTAIAHSRQGPVYLGYRLGHIKGQTSVFRAIVYNKAAMVLHMLRRLIGDEAFFKGVREFYAKWEFDKAGTGDFLAIMEQVSGRPLARFFDAWIFGETIPQVTFTSRIDKDRNEALVRFEQRGDPVEIPITVTVTYSSGRSADVVIAVADTVTEQRIPLEGGVRSITANADNGALAVIRR